MGMQPHLPYDGQSREVIGQETLPFVKKDSAQPVPAVISQLSDALLRGIAVENGLWSKKTADWVVSLQIADIDGDGNLEILVGARNGLIRAYTPTGERKWEHTMTSERPYLSALAVFPLQEEAPAQEARIIAGLRDGTILALDKDGNEVPSWRYATNRIIRQLFVSVNNPHLVVAASEDRYVHALSREQGQPLWKFRTKGWVRCVSIADIDGDGEEEVLVGSGDKHLYILNLRGQCLYSFFTGYQIYALSATLLPGQHSMQIVMSSNRKGLESWQFTRVGPQEWRQHRLWAHSPDDRPSLFKNRIHSIHTRDIDADGGLETIVGTEDGFLVVLDQYGELLWKQDFRSCVYRVTAADIDYDGNVELVIGTEDHTAYVERLELARESILARRIEALYAQAVSEHGRVSVNERLTTRERTLLKSFVDEPFERPARMEVELAKSLVQDRAYERALAILLRLYDQKVQYRWDKPFITQGYIWSGFFHALQPGADRSLVVGTDRGCIYGIDLTENEGTSLWCNEVEKPGPYRVRMLCSGATLPEFGATTIAVLANSRVVLLDQGGNVVKEQMLDEKEDWARYACFRAEEAGEPEEILVGMESGEILFWDSALCTLRGRITMPQGVGALAAQRLEPGGPVRIIGGGLQNRVFAMDRDGAIIWEFKTQDRVQSLRVGDIDRDGYAEIIVGSEDRNVYVLDHAGHLRWRYRTRRGVMDIDVEEIKMKGDSDDPAQRHLKILISSADSYLYMLNAEGDLIWKYHGINRMRVARVEDLGKDGRYELLVATEDRLELLQILDVSELDELIRVCLVGLTNDFDNHDAIRKLCKHPDPYIRGEALAVLAGYSEHTPEDMQNLLETLNKDEAIQIKHGVIRALPNLCNSTKLRSTNVRWAVQILNRLYHDPDEAVRLDILHILPLLNSDLFFKYLERSADHPDIWVRRAVVRQLDRLVEKSVHLPSSSQGAPARDEAYPAPEQILGLLLDTVRDEDLWVRQESGRVLAHYFDTHVASFVPDLMRLLAQGVELVVLHDIANSTRHPLLKPLFGNLITQVTELKSANLYRILLEAIQCIKALNELGPIYGEEWLQVYEEFHGLARVKIINEIAGYQRITRLDAEDGQEIPLLAALRPTLEALSKTSTTIAQYERRQAFGERVSTLIDARQILEDARADLRPAASLLGEQLAAVTLPGKYILKLLVEQWLAIVNKELKRLRGSAHLVATLGNTTVPRLEQVTVTLVIKNIGQCAADNVCIELEDSPDFVIIGEQQKKLLEISTRVPEQVDFVLHLYRERAHIAFRLTYDDAEAEPKQLRYADLIMEQETRSVYRPFENPYTPGPPIREKEMFFGRTRDLEELSKSLGSTTANRVILLRGQRRMGKTSLLYRLATELAAGPYAPVLIDMQSFALHTDPHYLLENFADKIQKDVYQHKAIFVPLPAREQFLSDAPATFNEYLMSVKEHLHKQRLILLIDEFEGIQRYVKPDDDGILWYLRGIMQHNPNLSFLLANASYMPLIEDDRAVFFNLVQEHKLGRFTPEEAHRLIVEPVRNNLEYDELAVQKMLALTDGWPYFIHVMSDKLVRYCNEQRRSYVTINEVNVALDQVLHEQTSSILWIWQGLSSSTERLVLALLAQEKGQSRGVVSLTDLRNDFDTYGVQFKRNEVVKALENLTRDDFIREAQDGVQYSIPLGLLKAWLCQEKPPERVVREVKSFEEDEEEEF